MRETLLSVALLVAVAAQAMAQGPQPCRVLCAPEFSVEPTVTFTNVFGSPRLTADVSATVSLNDVASVD